MNTKCETIAFGAVMLAILACLVWYMAEHPAPGGTPQTETKGYETVSEHAAYYDISATYPTVAGLGTTPNPATDAAAVSAMKQWIDETIAQFKQDGGFATMTPSDASTMGLGADRKESLQITYAIFGGLRTQSTIFTISMDTLGAHPNSAYKTFTFDTQTAQQLALADLFVPAAPYLERISTLTRKSLVGSLGNDLRTKFIEPGTTPDATNFEDFYITTAVTSSGPLTNLVILFPPYQVAPYSAGPQQVSIPFSQLNDILKPDYK